MKPLQVAQTVFSALALIALSFLPSCQPAGIPKYTHLTIIHTNDTHAHLDNVARRCNLVEQARTKSSASDFMLLDAGDVFAGTPYFTLYKGLADLWFMNEMKYDAMCLGNHEFDKGPDTLAPFVNGTKFPVLCANFDFSRCKELAGKIEPWTVIEKGKTPYGVFGLTTEETKEISSPGNDIVIGDHTAAAQKAVQYFKSKGINRIVALTHIGWDEDIKLASAVEGIDLIIGGHSHTVPEVYPTVVTTGNGQTLVVQAGCFNNYAGKLELDFTDDGVIKSWDGSSLIAIDEKIAESQGCAEKLKEYAKPIAQLRQNIVGSSQVLLDGEGGHVRTRETNLGDLVADALLAKAADVKADFTILNGGSIRSSIPAGDVSLGQVMEVLPFDNYLISADLSGAQVVASLENGVSQVEQVAGRFPQVAGLKYVWDPAAPVGKRIVAVSVRTNGAFEPIVPEKIYRVATTDYLAQGGDGYIEIKNAKYIINIGSNLSDLLADYMASHSPVAAEMDGRITHLGQ